MKMSLDAKVSSYSDECLLDDYDFEPRECERCGATIELFDVMREVMTDDRALHIICKRCADDVIYGVKS